MTRLTENTWRRRASALFALVAFLVSLLVAAVHPIEFEQVAGHDCLGHFDGDPGPTHDEGNCVLCDLGRAPTQAPDVASANLVDTPFPSEVLAPPSTAPSAPSLRGHHPRDPPV